MPVYNCDSRSCCEIVLTDLEMSLERLQALHVPSGGILTLINWVVWMQSSEQGVAAVLATLQHIVWYE